MDQLPSSTRVTMLPLCQAQELPSIPVELDIRTTDLIWPEETLNHLPSQEVLEVPDTLAVAVANADTCTVRAQEAVAVHHS
jgi:hypothetical protein